MCEIRIIQQPEGYRLDLAGYANIVKTVVCNRSAYIEIREIAEEYSKMTNWDIEEYEEVEVTVKQLIPVKKK